AAWCELHHITYWSHNGETSTENGLMLCSHHHKALHANMLQIERVNGEVRFKLHPLIDPAQEPRKNYFWQNLTSRSRLQIKVPCIRLRSGAGFFRVEEPL